MSKEMVMLEDFEELFLPNHSLKEMAKFEDPIYRRTIIERMLAGENVSLAELGIREFVLYSGRLSGKTQHCEFADILDITQGVGDIWYCRSEEGDVRNSIFSSIQSSILQLGYTISNKGGADFRVSYSPYEITHNATGNKFQFLAINKDINRTKGYFPPSGRLKRIEVEEANEVDDFIYIDALITTAVRFCRGDTKLIFRLNPPETKNHWSVGYFERRVQNGAKKIYTTWNQLAKLGLLNPATVSEILKMKKSDPDFYRYWYLGEIVNLQGTVFRHFDASRHCVTVDRKNLDSIVSEIIVAGDAANKNDPTCFGFLCGLTDGRILVLDAMYYDPRKKGSTDDVELGHMVCDWFTGVMQKYPGLRTKRIQGTVDNANWNLLRMLEISTQMGWFKWFPATDKVIERDTKRLQGMFRDNMLLFQVAEDNDVGMIVKEIEGYIYDPKKTNEIKKNQDDHGIDMLKYGTYRYIDTRYFF